MTESLIIAMFTIFIMIIPGVIAGKCKWITKTTTKELSVIVMKIFYPMMIFPAIYTKYPLDKIAESWELPTSVFLLMAFGSLIGIIAARLLKIKDTEEKNAFKLQCTINNYSFLPICLLAVLYAHEEEYVIAQLIFSTLGAEFAVWTIGVIALTGRKISWQSIKHLFSPPLIAIYLAIILRAITDISGTTYILLGTDEQNVFSLTMKTFEKIGLVTVPMSMFISGARMSMLEFHAMKKPLIWIISAFRLILIPLAAIAIINLTPMTYDIKRIFIVVAAMPVSFASIMLSEIYGGDKETITSSVLLTHILGVITIPIILSIFLQNI